MALGGRTADALTEGYTLDLRGGPVFIVRRNKYAQSGFLVINQGIISPLVCECGLATVATAKFEADRGHIFGNKLRGTKILTS